HLRAAAEAKVERPGLAAAGELIGMFEAPWPPEQSRYAAQHRDRRVVGMQREPQPFLLGHRQYGLDEVVVVGPHLLLGNHRAVLAEERHRRGAAERRRHEAAQKLEVV